jgi:prepilin-type N-terminal cleavage/methylation domain-containing protein
MSQASMEPGLAPFCVLRFAFCVHTKRARRGFTLVELLIVVGIIVVLAAVLVVSFSGVFSKRDDAVAKTTIETLSANLQSYQTKWHSYPMSTLASLTAQTRLSMPATDPNDTNMGIETLVVALRSKKNGGPYLDATLFGSDDFRKNFDSDELTDNAFDVDGALGLFEIVDPWGTPYVYINMNDVRNGSVKEKIQLEDGSSEELKLDELQEKLKHPTTGQYPQGYVIWSFGPDKKNDYGRGDDITSWPKYSD